MSGWEKKLQRHPNSPCNTCEAASREKGCGVASHCPKWRQWFERCWDTLQENLGIKEPKHAKGCPCNECYSNKRSATENSCNKNCERFSTWFGRCWDNMQRSMGIEPEEPEDLEEATE